MAAIFVVDNFPVSQLDEGPEGDAPFCPALEWQEKVGGRGGDDGGGSCDEARCKHYQSSFKLWMAARFSLTVFGLL